MQSQSKMTAIIIWFSILTGLFIILEFAAGGMASLSGDFNIQSTGLMLVGLIPPFMSVIGRFLVLTKATTIESFLPMLVICLALCEGPAIIGMFIFPEEFITERAFAFFGGVLGVILLCPVGMSGPWEDQARE